MSSFVLRKVDPGLWKQAREKCKRERLDLTTWIEAVLRAWLEK